MQMKTHAVLGGILLAVCMLQSAGAGDAARAGSWRSIESDSAPAGDVVVFPKPKTADLANGLHLLVLEEPRTTRVAFQLHMLGAGPYYDPSGLRGLASLTAGAAIRGTATRSFEEFLDDLKDWDAEFNLVAGGGGSTVTLAAGKVPAIHFPKALGALADLVRNPAFSPEEIEAVRREAKANLGKWQTSPWVVGDDQVARALYGQHPGASAEPTMSVLESVTRAQLVSFADERYVPDHTVLAIAGSVTFDDCLKRAEEAFGSWKRKEQPLQPTVGPADVIPGVRLVDMDTREARIHVAALAVNRTSPDFEPLEILTRILYADRRKGRLQSAMRAFVGTELSPEMPTVGAGLTAQAFGGYWRARVTAKLDTTSSALEGLLREIARLRDEPVDPEELKAVKDTSVSDYITSMEESQRRLASYLTSWIYKLPPDFWDKRPGRLLAITATQVRAVARKYLDPKRLVIVVVGPRDKLESQLKPFGSTTVLDTDGRVLSQ